MNFVKTSQDLLYSLKVQKPNLNLVTDLQTVTLDTLVSKLNSEEVKTAFWLNIYNSYFLLLRKYKQLEKPEIYRSKASIIAGINISLDDIEHGILRRFKYKYSLGYFNIPFAREEIKRLAVDRLDFRIHFALNCGAKSCPPIAFYSSDSIHDQLEVATTSFLSTDVQVDEEKKKIFVSRIFRWYFADFGGRKGIREILNKYLKLETAGYKISFSKYNWEEDLSNFS